MRKLWLFGLVMLLCVASAMAALPVTTFLNQTPSDITSTNVVSNPLNISFNISDGDNNLVLNTIKLYLKTNTSSNDISYFQNGKKYTGYNISRTYTSNSSWYFKWTVYGGSVYPATYNSNWTVVRSAAHTAYTLTNSNYWLKVQLYNVSSAKGENYVEVMVNNSAGTDYGKVYYCNSTYTTGQITTSTACVFIYNLPDNSYDHCHPGSYSCHFVRSFGITGGKIGTVDVTSTSYIMVNGRTGSTVRYWYTSPNARTGDTAVSSNSGVTWTNQAHTADVHLHQFDGSDRFFYYACAGDGTNTTCSTVRSESLDAGDVEPLATDYEIEITFEEGVCPTDTIANTLMFIFVGILLVGFALWASNTTILFFSIIVGLVGIIYSFPLYPCHPAYGLVVTLASVFYMGYEAFFRKFQQKSD